MRLGTETGINRDRQSYDHSRNGPVRFDTRHGMKFEANHLFGVNPKYMHNVWKG